jgi:rhombotail lipoprotein
MKRHHLITSCLSLLIVTLLSGCAQNLTRSSSSAPLGKMIEPIKDSQLAPRKSALTLPVSVAIVTVPSNLGGDRHIPDTTLRMASENLRQQLLASPKYVSSVAVVDQVDVEGKISLEKIRDAYAADIAIIVSYQQDQRCQQPGMFGLLDATVVGAFLIPGVEIKTSSVIDGKVIHLPSNAIVFRASGIDNRTLHSTSYDSHASFTEESIESLLAATTDFGTSLSRTITKFDHYDLSQAVPLSTLAQDGSAPANDYWKKVDTFKRTGGGAFGLIPLLIAAGTCCAAARRRS